MKHELLRVGSNALRMFLSLVLGLVLVQTLLGYGAGSYALYALVVVGFGLSIIAREWLRVALLPGLARFMAEDGPQSEPVRTRFTENVKLSLAFAIVAFVFLVGFAALLPVFGHGGDAAPWLAVGFVVLRAVYAASAIAIYPVFLLFLAQRQQVRLNGVLFAERLIETTAAIAIARFGVSEFESLFFYAALSTGLTVGLHLWLALRHRRYWGQGQGLGNIVRRERIHLWAGLRDVLAPMLYFRFDLIVLAAFVGPATTVILALGIQLVGYVRQISLALVQGADAVFASVHRRGGNSKDSDVYFSRAVFVQAAVVFFVCGALGLFRDDLLALWLGDRLEGQALGLPTLSLIFLILLPGALANSVSQGWTTMMTGAGELPSFVGLLLRWALLNPVLVFLAIIAQGSDARSVLIWVAAIYSALTVLCYLILLPRRLAELRGSTLRAMLSPLFGPALALGVGVIIVIGARSTIDATSIAQAAMFLATYALVLAPETARRLLRK